MIIKGYLVWRKSVLRTHKGDVKYNYEIEPKYPRFWVAEVRDDKVVRFIRPYIPRRLRNAIGKYLLRASIPGIYGAPMSYTAFRCYYCGKHVSRDALKIVVMSENIDLCYNCSEKLFGDDYPTILPCSANGEIWMGAPQPATAIAPLKYALTMKKGAGGLINVCDIPPEETYIYQERFKDPVVIKVPEKYRELLKEAMKQS